MDDRIENLQVISRKYNNLKDKKGSERVLRICPVCGQEFLYRKRDLCSHPNPCCSRKCGGIKSHWKWYYNVTVAGSSPAGSTKQHVLFFIDIRFKLRLG